MYPVAIQSWKQAVVLVAILVAEGGGCAAPDRADRIQSTTSTAGREPETVSLLGEPLFADPPEARREELLADLAAARASLAEDPDDPERIVWVGRRLGYLWRMREAIAVYTKGISAHPNYAPLYRHRGHRYISLRRFDDAIRDLKHAAKLIEGTPERLEPNGMEVVPDEPQSTTAYSVWYHLGLAYFLKADYEQASRAFRETLHHAQESDDDVVAASDWLYMTLRLLGRDREAAALLERITPDMKVSGNRAYYRRLLMYKGLLSPDQLLDQSNASELDLATMGFGLAQWHRINGRVEDARRLLQRIASGRYWPAFGVIAAEAELAREH